MALKDWRMERDFGRIFMREYVNKKDSSYELIVQKPAGRTEWTVYVNKKDRNILNKWFKTKSSALRFAKAYMRKH